jgi:predicted ATPase
MVLERDRELATLNSLPDDLHASGGRAVLTRGEAGIGKSTLIAESSPSRKIAPTFFSAPVTTC